MTKRNHPFRLAIFIAAIAAVPAAASADPQARVAQADPAGQQPSDQPGSAQGGQQGATQEGQQGATQEGQQGATQEGQQGATQEGEPSAMGEQGAPTGEEQRIEATMEVDQRVAFPVEGNCTYTATVKGKVTPIEGAEGEAQRLDPKLSLTAVLSCPGAADVAIEDNIMASGPLTADKLEDTLERRATIVAEAEGRSCAYKPEFDLTSTEVAGLGVVRFCEIAARPRSDAIRVGGR